MEAIGLSFDDLDLVVDTFEFVGMDLGYRPPAPQTLEPLPLQVAMPC